MLYLPLTSLFVATLWVKFWVLFT